MALWTLKDKNILVVDDISEMRSMMRSMLVPFGANKLIEARNGDEAVERMAHATMDIVLCDYNLGSGKDGQQVLEEAKERNLLPYSSIFIMVTAENTQNMVMGAVEYVPDDYLVKPFTKTVLQARIRKLQERKEGFRDISRALDARRYHDAIDLCNRRLAENGAAASEVLKLKGELLLRVGDYEAARQLFTQAMAQRDLVWARYGLGQALFHLKQYDDAYSAFEQLIARNRMHVAAYDWLARVHKALGDNAAAQNVLADAVRISPKAILRQKALAETALENSDLDTAERAYKNVVREGRNSIHRSPNDFGGLAKVYLKKDTAKEAIKVVASMGAEFQKSSNANQLQAAVVETLVYRDAGKSEESVKALARAMAMYAANPGDLPTASAMEMAEACFALGQGEHGNELLKHVIRNNHEDQQILAKVQELCAGSGQAELANLVETTRQEVIATNNQGVELVKQGKVEESIELFLKAARAMPENVTVNLNAALSLIALMKQSGVVAKLAQQTEALLDRVMRVAPENPRYRKVLQSYRELAAAGDAS